MATDLDHIAVAAESSWDLLDRYAGDLGGRFAGGGNSPGFHWSQVRFSNGMRLEMLQPRAVEEFDFLRRFLDRNGPGPHHLTFKVDDLGAAIEAAERAGYRVTGENRTNPDWQEAFLHPASSHGIVIQLAQQSPDHQGPGEPDESLPVGRGGEPARLERIVHLVADLDGATELFAGILGGRDQGPIDEELGSACELAWPGPGRLRLVQPTDPAARHWLGSRPGRVHHLLFSNTIAPPRSRPRARGGWELAPEHNQGLRLCGR